MKESQFYDENEQKRVNKLVDDMTLFDEEEVKPAKTKPVEAQPQQTKTEPNVNQISTDEASQALINQILANGGSIGIPVFYGIKKT